MIDVEGTCAEFLVGSALPSMQCCLGVHACALSKWTFGHFKALFNPTELAPRAAAYCLKAWTKGAISGNFDNLIDKKFNL